MVVPEASINNIMGGLESTAGVRLHNHRRKLKQRFDIVRKLGQGTYGKVQLGINKETGQEVAIKTIKKCKIETEADLIRIRREIQIMSSVQHPNIIHIYEVFENREKMVLVMEYAAGGELYDYISEKKVLNEAEARRIFRQIATAVYYCHKHKICHRDLKLENVLLDEHGSAKIADFGLSNVFDETHLLGTFCGSPLYASPEIVKGTPYHGPEVDCWSLGVLLYTLVYGSMPFDGSNFKRLVRQISQGDYFEPKKPSPASPLIAEMLKVNAARRADIVAICSHWWIDNQEAVPCLEVAEELANQTPVRLDLLLSLAPSACAGDKLLIPEQEEEATPVSDCPVRSQSLGSLAVTQPIDFLAEEAQRSKKTTETKPETTTERRKERSKSKRRERSSSRNRKRDESTPESDSYTEKPHRKSSKSKKKQQKVDETKKADESNTSVVDECVAEVNKMEEDDKKMAESDLKTSEVAEILKTISMLEKDYKAEDAAILKGDVSLDDYKMETVEAGGVEEKAKEVGGGEEVKTNVEEKVVEKDDKEPEKQEPATVEKSPPKQTTTETKKESMKKVDNKPDEDKPSKPMERRKSKIFETAEKFSQLQEAATTVKPPAKKVFLPGVKVSDAKKAYERKSSLASSSSVLRPASTSRRNSTAESVTSLSRRGSAAEVTSASADFDRKFSLASTVALNKLVEDVEKLARDEEEKEKKIKKKKEQEEEKKEKETVVEKTENKVDEGVDAKPTKEDATKPVVEEKKSADKLVCDERTSAKVSSPEKVKEKSVSPPGDATQVKKIQNAVQVIGNAIDSNNGEKKAATLPRRKTSRAEIKLTTPKTSKPIEFRSEVEHMVAAAPAAGPATAPAAPSNVQRSEVVFPVAAAASQSALRSSTAQQPVRSATLPPTSPQPKPQSDAAAPREHIIPIRFEATGDERPPPAKQTAKEPQRPVSRTNSKSLSRQSTADSDSGSVVSQGEPIRKSPREVIIPIAVEGGGFVTPNLEAVNRMSSLTESDDESSTHGFSLHSTRRPHNKQLDTADSVSSDEDDDNFEILTAESLFSALLSKVRNLTHRLNTEETRPPGFPRLFNHHSLFENSPSFSSRRLSEARSFNRADVPWRRSLSRDNSSTSSSTLPRDFSTRSSTLRPSLLHSRSIEPGTSKLPRRSPSLSLRHGEEKPPVYRQKFPRNSVLETTDAALDVTNNAANSKSPRQSLIRDDNGNRYSLQEKQVVDNVGKGSNLQEKQLVDNGSRGEFSNSQEKHFDSGNRYFSSNLQEKLVTDNSIKGLSSNLQDRQSVIRDMDERTQRTNLQDRQSMIREMVDNRMKRNSREENGSKMLLSERKSMIKDGGNGDDCRRSESRSFSSSLSERQSMVRELGDERSKLNKSPYWDERQSCSSNSDLSDSYRTAKNSRSVSVENNSLEMSASAKRLGDRLKNSFSDLSESSRRFLKIGDRKSGDDLLRESKISNGDGSRSRKSSDVTKRQELEGVRREYNRSVSTDRRRFSYLDGTPLSSSARLSDSLRTRRHSKDFSLTSSGSFSDRITAKDIEKFRSEFRRTNSSSAEIVSSRLKTSDSANNNLTENSSTSTEVLSNQQNSNDGVDSGGSVIENGDDLKDSSNNLKSSNLNVGEDSNGNIKLKNVNSNEDVMKYKKPESPLLFAMKESTYQKPSTNTQYSTRRKSYISSVLDRDDGKGLLRNGSRLESNGSPDFRRSISLNYGSEELRGARRSHSVTPDRSVLGKFLETEKIGDSKLTNSNSVYVEGEKRSDTKLNNSLGESDAGDSRMHLRSRRVSRFLRPDFYDTPREESVYVKSDVGGDDKVKTDESEEQEVKKKKKSRVKETIRSLRESSLPKECDLAISESSLIKRAVSLDDCSVVGSVKPTTTSRLKRASSVSSDRRVILEPLAKIESFIKKKMSTDKRKKKATRDEKTEESLSKDSVVTRLARKISPKLVKNLRRRSCVGAPLTSENGVVDLEGAQGGGRSEVNGYRVDKSSSEVSQSRASRIANLKKLDFTKPHRSADSTPSFDDYDDSSLMLMSPNDDNSDSWSAASDYLDARDFTVSPTSHSASGEESVSERIRRKSFYSRFNQLKKKKVTATAVSSPTSSAQVGILSPRLSSRLPTYRKSMSSSLPISSGEQPADK